MKTEYTQEEIEIVSKYTDITKKYLKQSGALFSLDIIYAEPVTAKQCLEIFNIRSGMSDAILKVLTK